MPVARVVRLPDSVREVKVSERDAAHAERFRAVLAAEPDGPSGRLVKLVAMICPMRR